MFQRWRTPIPLAKLNSGANLPYTCPLSSSKKRKEKKPTSGKPRRTYQSYDRLPATRSGLSTPYWSWSYPDGDEGKREGFAAVTRFVNDDKARQRILLSRCKTYTTFISGCIDHTLRQSRRFPQVDSSSNPHSFPGAAYG